MKSDDLPIICYVYIRVQRIHSNFQLGMGTDSSFLNLDTIWYRTCIAV